MYYKVTLFILGLPASAGTREEIIEADTQEQAEQKADDWYVSDGWGVLDSVPCTADGEELVVINKPGAEEIIKVRLSKTETPVAYQKKLEELLEEGVFDTQEEAEKWLNQNPIVLELYYEKGCGLFAVESDALESSTIKSPYTGYDLVEPEEK